MYEFWLNQMSRHYLNQWWFDYWCIASLSLNVSGVLVYNKKRLNSYLPSFSKKSFQSCGFGDHSSCGISHWETTLQCTKMLSQHSIMVCNRGYPAKRALPTMLTHGRWGPFGRIPLIYFYYGVYLWVRWILLISLFVTRFSVWYWLWCDLCVKGSVGETGWDQGPFSISIPACLS